MIKYILFFLVFIQFSAIAQKDSVNCSIQIQDLWDLDLNKSTVMVDFNLVVTYKKPEHKKFNFLNSTIISIDTLVNDDSAKFFTVRIIAELRTNFDFNSYPLDKQKIIIKLEPYLYFDELVCFSNKKQNIFIDKTNLNGWKTDSIRFSNPVSVYKIEESNGENIYKYSAVLFEIPIVRKRQFFYFTKFFLPSLISILIIYIGFLLPPKQIEPRLNLSLGSLFVMISNFIVIQQMLPSISTITLIEKINIVSLVIISLTILFFSLSYRFKDKFSDRIWYKLNLWFVVSSIASYFLLLFLLFRYSN